MKESYSGGKTLFKAYPFYKKEKKKDVLSFKKGGASSMLVHIAFKMFHIFRIFFL